MDRINHGGHGGITGKNNNHFHIDSKNGWRVFDLLVKLNRDRSTTLLLVTHDHALASQADRMISLSEGRIVEDRERESEGVGERESERTGDNKDFTRSSAHSLTRSPAHPLSEGEAT